MFRPDMYTHDDTKSLCSRGISGDNSSYGYSFYRFNRRRRPRHPLPAGRLSGGKRLPRPRRGRWHGHVESAGRSPPRPARAGPEPARRRRPDPLPQAARQLQPARDHADRPQRAAGAHPQLATPQSRHAVQHPVRQCPADEICRLDPGPDGAPPGQSRRPRHHAVGCGVPPAAGVPRASQPRAQPRPAAQSDPGPRRRSLRPFDRHPDQPPAPETGRRCPRAANHQDGAQRRLRAGRPGDGGAPGMKAFIGSMTGRVFITLLLGILLTAGLSQWAADKERQRAIEGVRDVHALERAEQLIMATEVVPASARLAYLAVANRPGLRLEEIKRDLPHTEQPSEFAAGLAARLGGAYQISSVAGRPAECDAPHPRRRVLGPGSQPWRGTCEALDIRLRDGELLRMSVLPPRASPINDKTNFTWIIGLFLVGIALLAYMVARMTTQPLKQLAQAAKDLGNDINRAPLDLTGASEIRQASAAFNAMQARIRQYITQRTQMLAAITHDLQTPLTRLRLRLEKVGDPELQERLIGDLSAMQAMVREGLELARSMDTTEAMHSLDVDSLLDSVCADASEGGQKVALHGSASVAVLGRPMSLRRCLVNLIDNAVKYGHQADVFVERLAGAVRIRIRDAGPGIAADELARVFEPFYRIETSRSRESGGTGLGLTIARNIAEQHGGTITLLNHAKGGLEVTLLLPES